MPICRENLTGNPTLRKPMDYMEGTVDSYRRYKRYAVISTEEDITKLTVMFQESVLHSHVDGGRIDVKGGSQMFGRRGSILYQ